jgi:hypothetical protein
MAEEFIDSQFNLNSKLFTSLRLLLTRPGFLTTEYNAGRRVRYITPLRLYLIASALFFVVAALGNGGVNDPSPTLIFDTDPNAPPPPPGVPMSITDEMGETPAWLTDPNHPIGRLIVGRTERVRTLGETAFERLLGEQLLGNIPKMMFVLLPLFALLLRLLYRRAPFLYFEHLIFALHYHTVVFTCLTGLSLMGTLLPPAWDPVETLVVLLGLLLLQVYLVIALRRVYGQGWRITTAKYTALFVSYTALLLIAISVTSIITFFLI